MNHRERVLSSIAKQGYGRIPVKHEGTPEVNHELMAYFLNYLNLIWTVCWWPGRKPCLLSTWPKTRSNQKSSRACEVGTGTVAQRWSAVCGSRRQPERHPMEIVSSVTHVAVVRAATRDHPTSRAN